MSIVADKQMFLTLHSENGIPPQTQFARGINILRRKSLVSIYDFS